MNKNKIFWFSLLFVCASLFYFLQRFSKKVPRGEYKIGIYIISGGDYAGIPASKLEVIDSEDNLVLTSVHNDGQLRMDPDLKIEKARNLRAKVELHSSQPIHDGELELHLKENQGLWSFTLLLLCVAGMILSTRKLLKIFSS